MNRDKKIIEIIAKMLDAKDKKFNNLMEMYMLIQDPRDQVSDDDMDHYMELDDDMSAYEEEKDLQREYDKLMLGEQHG